VFGLLNSLFYAKRKVKRRDEEKQSKEKNAHGRKKAGRLTFVGGVGGVLLRALISLGKEERNEMNLNPRED
jgi:hypothetical protein